MTPSRWRSSSWTPQKQPPARIAVSLLSLIALSFAPKFRVCGGPSSKPRSCHHGNGKATTMSKTSHPSAVHHVELNPMKSVPRRGFGRRWYQRRVCGVGAVEDMRVLLVETGSRYPNVNE